MKNELEMLEHFQVENLEKKYEMGWVKVEVSASPAEMDESYPAR
ncbi:hypothetical protein [Tamlana sp. s12]|nr:hypothetical protein [Tamlana sp. s12]